MKSVLRLSICLAGGCFYTEWDESGNPTSNKTVQWIVNGETTVQDFSGGCIGNSDLRRVPLSLFHGKDCKSCGTYYTKN